ncbi:glycoside hydrolase family 43 protein [Zasmidium cellare ATCC 36951]|uniref:Glycoside hydrolase family 43 protein n=1 Tax=Zasmidium cellare ATCC 36951 TaxID=1080233 RepID=A0A6A6CFN1_ZASCE|nr:glycoside hydrolase family 43 protein [Zasmidium cellare ATCC 36951]KAF2165050.1 glycoside hydrolase family 43 protein [Zasmidium cellare ATCC 36951]
MPPQPCLNITSTPTPDPHFTHVHGKFYLTFTANDRIPLWEAPNLLDFWEKPKIGPVWRPPPNTPHSSRLWAPELHALQGRWYIYYAAADPAQGNRSHRMYVLGGPPASEDPHDASRWEFLGPIQGMDQRQWAIDGTVFELDGELYFVYSGWPMRPQREWNDFREDLQLLYILRLSDPTTAASEPVEICRPHQPWEHLGHIGICEGPQWLEAPDGSWRGLVYSCAASWTKHYKMATLEYLGGNPLDPASWKKSTEPLLQDSDDGQGPFGPGHGCFLNFGGETVALFHATDSDTDGNQGRKCRLQRVEWSDQGPHMGEVLGSSTRDIDMFSKLLVHYDCIHALKVLLTIA